MKRFKFLAVIWKEEAGYVSYCSELEVSSCGDSPEEALPGAKHSEGLWM